MIQLILKGAVAKSSGCVRSQREVSQGSRNSSDDTGLQSTKQWSFVGLRLILVGFQQYETHQGARI